MICADVEIAIGPAVEPSPDARRERVVDRGVAEGALDADGPQAGRRPSKKPVTPTTALSLSSASVVAGIVEVDPAVPQMLLSELAGSASTSTLRPTASAVVGAEPGADAAIRGARDRLVQPQAVAPERLVAERVEAERLPAFVQGLARVLEDVGVRAPLGTRSRLDLRGRAESGQQTETRDSDQRHEERAIGHSHDDSSGRAVERDSRVLDLQT